MVSEKKDQQIYDVWKINNALKKQWAKLLSGKGQNEENHWKKKKTKNLLLPYLHLG